MGSGEDDAPDFLDLGEADQTREAQFRKDLEFAELHLVFVQDPRAAQLLKMWEETVAERRVPLGSSLDAYAAAEAVRAFIAVIKRQIKFAQSGKPTTN